MQVAYGKNLIAENEGASLDYLLSCGRMPLMVSYFDRSLLTVKAVGANFNAKGRGLLSVTGDRTTSYGISPNGYDTFVTKVDGYDPFYHGVAIAKELHSKYLLTTEGREEEDFYNFLMRNYDLPLVKQWSSALWNWAKSTICRSDMGMITFSQKGPEGYDREIVLPNGKKVRMTDLRVYFIDMTAELFEEAVSNMLKSRTICIAERSQRPLEFQNMDEYFNRYGGKIVKNLSEQLNPLVGFEAERFTFAMKEKRPYAQQMAMINGSVALLSGVGNKKERRESNSNYAFLSEGCGVGKTLQAICICESYAVSKLLRMGMSLKDVYSDKNAVNYRVIIMCPGHLVEKWAEEIRNEVPYARVKILQHFEDILEVKKKGLKRNGKEFYVISKDFAKLSYSEKPVPTRYGTGRKVRYPICKCGREVTNYGAKCSCGSTERSFRELKEEADGMICPSCHSLLLPLSGKKKDDDDAFNTLRPGDFCKKTSNNESCCICGEKLWQPYVANIGESKANKWKRITRFANKAKKNKVTEWVHEDFVREYLNENCVSEGEYNFAKGGGTRRVDPASFIKKHMKGFFDIAVFDEVHTLKGGDTAQGKAMHALVKASKKQLALTGTIAGGFAHHLFYTLFRLDSKRMREKGYTFTGVSKFIEDYGSVETKYEPSGYEGHYNMNSRGKKLTEPKVKPGISPLIFTEFLLDKAVMLDITDLSSHLPQLHENVVLVEPEDEEEIAAHRSYAKVVEGLKSLARSGGMGMTVLSTMLQFSLSYLDKPYGVAPMLNPLTGEKMIVPENFDKFSNIKNLLSKEKKMVEIVKSELAEGRNCFIYAEYTNNPETCVTGRLRDVLMYYLNLKSNEVVILESDKVGAQEREAWLHKRSAEGMKVCITNPKCVETGLDFCFKYEGVVYNSPTIIYMQMGYNMFTVAQSSRRHYRLNQKEECRTYYMAYKGTIQEVVIGIIAEKMAASSAIQGKFSSEGLTAMAHGIDTRVRLAQALSDMDNETGKELQSMFDVVNNSTDNEDDSEYKRMELFHELLGIEKDSEELDGSELFNLLETESGAEVIEPLTIGSIFRPVDARRDSLEKQIADIGLDAVLFASLEETELNKTVVSSGHSMEITPEDAVLQMLEEQDKEEEGVEEDIFASLLASFNLKEIDAPAKKGKRGPIAGQQTLF